MTVTEICYECDLFLIEYWWATPHTTPTSAV